MPELLGYHGTKEIAGRKILKEKRFNPSNGDRHWLGDGVYFFENLAEANLWWENVLRIKSEEAAVVKAKIICEEDKILDLTSSKALDNYNLFLMKMETKIQKKIQHGQKVRFDGCAINMLCQITPFDVIRAPFPSHLKDLKKIKECSSIIPVQIQLCVRNAACIQSNTIELTVT